MKKSLVLVVMLLVVLVSSCTKIDAGFTGLKVNKYGDEKGVDKVVEVSGMVWYNPMTTDIYEVPTYTLDYSFNDMQFKTKDMMSISLGVGVQLQLPSENVPDLFIKYRRYFSGGSCDFTALIQKYVRQGFSNAVGEYNAEELIVKKEEFRNLADAKITEQLEELNFNVGDVFLIHDPNLPQAVMQAVDDKIKAKQIADKKQQEVMQATYDAEKMIQTAKGDSAAAVIRAAGEAQALKLKKAELNSNLVQQMWIDKWNGSMGEGNVYGASTIPVKNISK